MWCAAPLVAGFLLTRRFRRWRSLVVLASIGAVVVAGQLVPDAPLRSSTHVKTSVLVLCAMITLSGTALAWLAFAGLLWPGVLIRRMWAYERWRNPHISSTSSARRDG